jgi:integrase
MRTTSETLKITKATIDAVWRRRNASMRIIVRDKDCRGLALIVNETTMRWEYAYRPRGTDPVTGRRWPNRTITLGNPATHSPDDARNEANRLKGQAAAGGDPAAERRAKAEAERRRCARTLGLLVEEYAQALPQRAKMRGTGMPSLAYVKEELAQVKLALAAIEAADTPAADLRADDVRRLLAVTAASVAGARKRFGALNRFLDWCQDVGHIPANPCAMIARSRRPKAPQARAHYLTPAELARLWRAAVALHEPVWRDFSRFLMAMPCRRGEAARVDWAHLDLDAAEWRQPGQLTKNRDPHRLHLHPLALAILRERHEAAGRPAAGLVFSAPMSGAVLNSFTDIKVALAEKARLTGWTWHDFRRSFATALGEAGIPEAVADAVLNHRQAATRGGVLGVYQRASRWPEQVKAMKLWGRVLAASIDGKDICEGVLVGLRVAERARPG